MAHSDDLASLSTMLPQLQADHMAMKSLFDALQSQAQSLRAQLAAGNTVTPAQLSQLEAGIAQLVTIHTANQATLTPKPTAASGSIRFTNRAIVRTDPGDLFAGQAHWGFSARARINRSASGGSWLIWSDADFTAAFVIRDDGAGHVEIGLAGSRGSISGSARYTAGSAFHMAGAWESGRQTLYFNGEVIASSSLPGPVYSGKGQLFFGYSPGSSDTAGDAQIGDINCWTDHAPTGTEVVALRDRKVDPRAVGPTGPAWRYTCLGAHGATVAIGSPGVMSSGTRTGAANGVAALSIPAGSTLAYSADPLDYIVPVTVTPYVTKSGKWLACLAMQAAQATPLGTLPAAIAAITSQPQNTVSATIRFGGSGAARFLFLYGDQSHAPWWDSDGDMPEAYWQLCCGKVESTIIYDGGSGYATSGTKVTTSGGLPTTAATYDAIVKDGVIKSIEVKAGGSQHGSGLLVTVTGGGGSGFRGVCLVGPTDALQFIQVLDGGSGYAHPFAGTVSVTDEAGNPVGDVTLGAVVVWDGVITGLTPTNGGGADYTSLPALEASGTGSGFRAAPIMTGVAPSDVLTLSWPDGFLRTAIGASAGATGAPVANYSGRDEAIVSTSYTIPGWGKIPWSLFGPATSMRVGTNLYGPTSMNIQPYYANWAHGVGLWPFAAEGGATVPGMTADGWPTALGDTGSAYGVIHDNEALFGSMGPDFRGAPLVTGRWSLVWDDASPIDATTPRTVLEWLPYGRTSTDVVSSGPTVVSSGTLGADGVLRGIVHAYDLSYPPGSKGFGRSMCLSFTNRTTRVNTAVKGTVQLIPPNNPVPLPSDAAPDLNLVAQLRGCGIIRAMKTFPVEAGAVFDASQIPSMSDFSWGQRYIAPPLSITEIRRYDVARSPYVYLWSCAGFDTPANRAAYATPADDPMHGIAPYRVPAVSPAYTWLPTENNFFVVECVTPAPHGIRTCYLPTVTSAGELMTIENGLPGTANYASVSMGLLANSTLVCFVTGPSTFAAMCYNGTGLVPNGTAPGNANNVSATGGWTYPGSGPMPSVRSGANTANPPETLAGLVNALPGCVCHVALPIMLDDGGVTAYATRLRDTLDRDHEVLVEAGNENWNMFTYSSSLSGYQVGYLLASNGLVDGSHGFNTGFCTQRGYEVFHVFRSVFASTGRGAEVKWALGGAWGADEGGTSLSTQIDYCLAHGLVPDVYLAANYQSFDDVAYLHAAALVAVASHPASSAYGTPRPLPLTAYIDLLRHRFPLVVSDNGPYGSPRVGTYHTILSQLGRLSQPPAFVAYEGGAMNFVDHSLAVSSSVPGVAADHLLPGKLVHDIVHHPAAVDLISSSWGLAAQNGGMTNADYFMVRAPRFHGGWGDGWGRTTWSISTWTGQLPGMGDGSDGLAVNRFCLFPAADGTPPDGRSHDAGNVNPLLLSWQRQARAANPGTGPHV